MPQQAAIVFLAGPPGAGKSTLGRRVSADLGLRFVDLGEQATGGEAAMQALEHLLAARSADIVELPWELQLAGKTLKNCRRAGILVALWAHPLDMQSRSGRADPLFSPGRAGLTTHGGFGRLGVSCPEYRRLARACQVVLDLVELEENAAARALHELLVGLRVESSGSPAEQEGLDGWGRYWEKEYRANPRSLKVLLDAMALYLQQLKQHGVSPRTIRSTSDDLQALGMLTFGFCNPKPDQVLTSLWASTYDYGRKFSESPNLIARFERTAEKFERFLAERGLVQADDGE
jgi:hypothetical protein